MRIPIVLILSLMILFSGCQTQKPTIPIVKEQRVYWGNKEEVKTFLDSPKAMAERWFIQAVGD